MLDSLVKTLNASEVFSEKLQMKVWNVLIRVECFENLLKRFRNALMTVEYHWLNVKNSQKYLKFVRILTWNALKLLGNCLKFTETVWYWLHSDGYAVDWWLTVETRCAKVLVRVLGNAWFTRQDFECNWSLFQKVAAECLKCTDTCWMLWKLAKNV